MDRLTGKVAAITGGASGIGAGTVRRFVEEGAEVLIADLDETKGAALAAELGSATAFLRTDVSKEEDVAAMVAETTDRFGRIDVLFNNAGFGGALGPIESTTVADYDLTMDVLLKSVFLGMKHVAPLMKAQGSGSIISTASVAGIRARLRAAPLQRRQERGHPSHQDGRPRAGRARRPCQRHLSGVHRHGARRRAPRRRREPDRPDASDRRCLAGARPGGRGSRHRQHGDVPRQRRVRLDHRTGVRRRRRFRSRTVLVALAGLRPHGAPDPPPSSPRPLTSVGVPRQVRTVLSGPLRRCRAPRS